MMIPDELIERVRESADIVHIIGEHVKLKRAGADFRGPCPFHGGKNPNFSVSPRRGMYHCFKCQESGSVFTFLQKHLGMSFPEAVREVAAIVGIEIPDYQTDRTGPDPREPFWEANAIATAYFKTQLWEDAGAAPARTYLEQRGITREIADRFELGYAPREIGVFRAYMSTMGFGEERLLEAGLLVKPDENSEPRPRFRGRLMFPILDAAGHHIAFGGRALGDMEPKYLNSSETQVFVKGRTLYGLNWTRNDIRREDRVFVVEGYFDAIRLMVSGFNIAVAPLGTALTEAQVELLSRYTHNVYLLYDSDQAGLKATFRAGDELLRQRMTVRVVTFPGGEDPDTFVQKNGADALEQQVAQAVDIFERKLQILERGGWFSELQKKRRALDRLLPTLRATADPLLQELYISRAAEKTGINKDVLLREVRESPPRDRGPGRVSRSRDARGRESVGSGEHPHSQEYAGEPSNDFVPPPPPEPFGNSGRAKKQNWKGRGRGRWRDREAEFEPPPARPRTSRALIPAVSAECDLIRVMLTQPEQITSIADRIDADRFLDPDYRAIFEAALEVSDHFSVEALADVLDPGLIATLNELLDSLDGIVDVNATVTASIAQIQIREMRERQAEIDRAMTVANDAEKDQLLREKLRLKQEILALGQPLIREFPMFHDPRERRRS